MWTKTLQIMWHQRLPVFSVDFGPEGELATCGADKEIRLWKVFDREEEEDEGGEGEGLLTDEAEEDGGQGLGVEYICNLSAHSKTVNVVRFSPDGTAIASAGDSGEVVLWRKSKSEAQEDQEQDRGKAAASPSSSTPFGADKEKGSPWSQTSAWRAVGTLRGQMDDVQDLAWSPDSSALVTGSVENVAPRPSG